uniref:MobA-like NTP transferase domain-containing protein n=1 Tax=uncultured Alphaproteobacteria bacterium TaxID=91750 RepID=A0A6M4NNA0_9PROT|nr:hypothetical protein PlAlph_2540 [uncultured Alphaproteobacteria bacterium]
MENLERAAKLKAFVADYAQTGNFEIKPLATDASSRKYYRAVFADGNSIVIMDDENCRCKTKEFVELSAFLRNHGVYVPEVLAKNMDEGILLLEDLGDGTITRLLPDSDEKELYLMSAEPIAKIAAIDEQPQCVTAFDKQKLLSDIRLFTDWYIPMATGKPLSEQEKSEFLTITDTLSTLAFKIPNRLVLWDYHIDNIMLPPNSKSCAVIDFQDAMWGPMTYDLISLLAADRRTASPETVSAVKDAFFNTLQNINREDFEDSCAFLSMFRHMRVLGRFTTLSMVNRKEKYLNYIPQTWAMLEQILNYPKLAPVKQWVDKHLPPELRKLPQRKPIDSAIVLAAGRGSRMQNLTDDCPKPLIKVGKKSLIDYNIERLHAANIGNLVVNLCYKGEMIRRHLDNKFPELNISFSEETEALETGGGVKNALPMLKGSAFFVCNSDVFFIDRGYKPALWRMMDEWDGSKHDILLLLQPVNDICGDKGRDYRITPDNRPERNEHKQPDFDYMFGGISIVSRKIFDGISADKFSLRDLFDIAQKQGRLGFIINNADFFHVGTPEALKAAEIKINRYK